MKKYKRIGWIVEFRHEHEKEYQPGSVGLTSAIAIERFNYERRPGLYNNWKERKLVRCVPVYKEKL